MKHPFIILLIKVAAVFIVALLCDISYYSFDLNLIAKVDIEYRQWLGITIISTLLFHKPSEPVQTVEPTQNDSERH